MSILPTVVGAPDESDEPSHRHLSVAEMQQALRQLQERTPHAARRVGGLHRHPDDWTRSELQPDSRRPRHSRELRDGSAHSGGDNCSEPRLHPGDNRGKSREVRGDNRAMAARIAVLAAHPGAGASTVALAISDAAAADGTFVHLIENAPPLRSGLMAAAFSELGADAEGHWRRGRRGNVTLERRATASTASALPSQPADNRTGVTVVDLGLVDAYGNLPAVDCTSIVIVCRTSVPGVRLSEHLLGQLAGEPVVVAALGPGRWPGEVTASLGPRLHALREAGRVVAIPMNRRLAVTGLTSAALPKPVLAAGGNVFRLLALPSEETDRAAASRSTRLRGAARR